MSSFPEFFTQPPLKSSKKQGVFTVNTRLLISADLGLWSLGFSVGQAFSLTLLRLCLRNARQFGSRFRQAESLTYCVPEP